MTEAVHVAAAIRGGASLVHGVQMRKQASSSSGCDVAAYRSSLRDAPLALAGGAARAARARCAAAARQRVRGAAVAAAGLGRSRRRGIEIFQINVGKLCNQTCRHCHVDAGPDRTRGDDARDDGARASRRSDATAIPTVDITGGAPELNPAFPLARRASARRAAATSSTAAT